MTASSIKWELLSFNDLFSLLTSCTQGRCGLRAVVVMKERPHSVWDRPEKFCMLHMQMHTGGRDHECIWDGSPEHGGRNIRAPRGHRSKIDRWLTPEDHEIAKRAGELLWTRSGK